MSVNKKVNSKGTHSKVKYGKVKRGGWKSPKATNGLTGFYPFAGEVVANGDNTVNQFVADVDVVSSIDAVSGGKSRKSSKKSLRRKSLVHKKKRCPKYCRRKSVRCKSYRPVRKSRKHR